MVDEIAREINQCSVDTTINTVRLLDHEQAGALYFLSQRVLSQCSNGIVHSETALNTHA